MHVLLLFNEPYHNQSEYFAKDICKTIDSQSRQIEYDWHTSVENDFEPKT